MSILRWPTQLLLCMFGSAGSVGNWKEMQCARATSNWIAWFLKWKQIISWLMGLISRNNSRFSQLAILHVISADALPLLGMLLSCVCSLNVLEFERRTKRITFSAPKVDQMCDALLWPVSFELAAVGDRTGLLFSPLLFTRDRTEEQSYYQKEDKREGKKKWHKQEVKMWLPTKKWLSLTKKSSVVK